MRTDKELEKILVEQTVNYTDTAPVFRIRNQDIRELHNESIKLALPCTNASLTKELRFDRVVNENHVLLRLPDDATLRYFPASGYKSFQKNTAAYTKSIGENVSSKMKHQFEKAAPDLLERNRLNLAGAMEELRFEKLFQLKSAGISSEKKVSPVVLNRLVYAYRRFVNKLPVLGSASVFIKVAAEYELDAFGIDWRDIHDAHLTMAKVISPEDAAVSALEQLQNTNPEKVYTANEIEPVSFELGYFSHSKTMHQTVLQPVYVAKFIFKGKFRMGHAIVVPAAGSSYESICRKATPPPFNTKRG